MSSIQIDHQPDQIITMYVPIFREKLEKLERRGQGRSEDAIKLRKALAQVDRVQSRSRLKDRNRPSLAAAE